MTPWSQDLDLTEFYAKAAAKGYDNNATQKMNKNTEATANAYREFGELNKQTKEVTLPVVNSISTGFDNLATAQNNVGKATKQTTEAIKEQDAWLDRWNKKWGNDPTGAKAVAAAKAARAAGVKKGEMTDEEYALAILGGGTMGFEASQRLIAQLTGQEYDPTTTGRGVLRVSDILQAGLGGVNAKVIDEAMMQLVQEGLLVPGTGGQPTYQSTTGQTVGDLLTGRVNQITINVNGTVVNPEGTARAITNVLQNSNARSGVGVLTPVLGLE